MERKHWVIGAFVVVAVAAVAYVAGYASAPDSTAHVVPRDADEWTALAAWLALAAALAAAWYAKEQADEARKIRVEQAQPEVVAYLEQDPDIASAVEIVIANFGPTAARNLQVKCDGPVRGTLGDRGGLGMKDVVIPQVFSMLAPGQQWRTFWDWAPARDKHPVLRDEKQVTLLFEYVGAEETVQHRESTLDWSVIDARTFGEKKTVHHAAKAIIRIADVIAPKPRRRVPLPHGVAGLVPVTFAPGTDAAPLVDSVAAPKVSRPSKRERMHTVWRALFGR
ncbi:hypothetical protein ACFVTZ_02250 [Cellulosimicrobium cellulans]|uniref:hypothetical protein n=1 Tax=Cellulosimicrobium cellulans TaxID=1710 RepID=UPI0036EFD014